MIEHRPRNLVVVGSSLSPVQDSCSVALSALDVLPCHSLYGMYMYM